MIDIPRIIISSSTKIWEDRASLDSHLGVGRKVEKKFEAGVLLIDKPSGPTSFAMVRQVRRLVGIKKVGHAGTLDPFASGLLVICAGRPATRMISSFMDGEKEYLATLRLGVRTTTLDPEGEVIDQRPVGKITTTEIERCLDRFRGELLQRPPIYSAVKHKGKPLYYYARRGIEIVKEPRRVTIDLLERQGEAVDICGDQALLQLRVVCSKGTYIRVLASDIGDALGCGASLCELRRLRSGRLTVEQAVDGKLLNQEQERETVLQRMISVESVGNLLQ